MSKVVVAGGGAAGIMAAIAAAQNGNEVHIYEKNEKLGKKLFITGKGRCNLTNASDIDGHLKNVVTNAKFLHGAYSVFFVRDIISLIEGEGVPLKTERGNRVFPESGRSSDIISALVRILNKAGVTVHLNSTVKSIKIVDNAVRGIYTGDGFVYAESVIIATGGLSYPATGSTGDGYGFCRAAGHKVNEGLPALVPLHVAQRDICKRLEGLSLRNIGIAVFDGERKVYDDFGEMLFTADGLSGPVILSASSRVTGLLKEKNLRLLIDLKPALDHEKLDKRILRDFDGEKNKSFKNSLDKLLPRKIIPVVVDLCGIDPEKKVNSLTKGERRALVRTIKGLEFSVTETAGFNEAVITQGGVDVGMIDPRTMRSRLVDGLYVCGELLDLDALTGGYNLQIAWSTGFVAGNSVRETTDKQL